MTRAVLDRKDLRPGNGGQPRPGAARVSLFRGVRMDHLHCPLQVEALVRYPDPTHTTTLRLQFMRQMDRYWRAIKRDIATSIVANDCFDIEGMTREIETLAAVPRKAFGWQTLPRKIESFMDWLRLQEDAGILSTMQMETGVGIPSWVRRSGAFRSVGAARASWMDTYIDSAYMSGIRQKRAQLRAAGYPILPDQSFVGGISAYFNQPFHAEAVAEIYARAYEDLKTVTQVTNAAIRRKIGDGLRMGLARGMAEGKHPSVIARDLMKDVTNRVDKIGVVRARMIARTEVIRAHHVAGMTEYERAEIDTGEPVMLDWLFGGGPCPSGICPDNAAQGPYKRTDFPELPAHPRCTCSSRPVVLDKETAARLVARARRMI